MALSKMRVQLLDEETGVPIKEVDILTSGEAVLFNDGENAETKINDINNKLDEKVNKDDVFVKSEILNSTLEIGKWIDFHSGDDKNIDFNGRLYHDNTSKRFISENNGETNKILEQRDIVNNLSTTQEGFTLDARQGKILSDMISKFQFISTVVDPNGQNTIKYTTPYPIDRFANLVLAQNGDLGVWGGDMYLELLSRMITL